METDLEKRTNTFLKKTKTSFKAEFEKFDKYFPDDTQRRSVFRITLKRGNRKFSFLFGQSIAESGFCFPRYSDKINNELRGKTFLAYHNGNIFELEKTFLYHANNHFGSTKGMEYYKLRIPSAYDVLAGLTKNEVGTFEDFCNDYGFSTDSIKAKTTYDAVKVEFEMVQKLWTDKEIEQLQEIN